MWVSWSCDKTLSENSLRGQVKLQELLKKKSTFWIKITFVFPVCKHTMCGSDVCLPLTYVSADKIHLQFKTYMYAYDPFMGNIHKNTQWLSISLYKYCTTL